MLTLSQVSKSYGKFPAVEDNRLEMEHGLYGMLAPNGAGKTTLIKMIATLLVPTQGEILWDGIPVAKLGEKYRDLLGDTTIAENRDEGRFIWDNRYDEEEGINYYELAVFLPREDGLYEKSEEVHCQKAYPQEEIETLIKEAGMELLAVYDAYTLNPATEDSERLFFVAREKGKKKQ